MSKNPELHPLVQTLKSGAISIPSVFPFTVLAKKASRGDVVGAEYFRPKNKGGESYEIVVVIVEHRDIESKSAS